MNDRVSDRLVLLASRVKTSQPLRCLFVVGTRPEVIKMWPLIRLAQRHPDRFVVRVINTGQQREMARAALSWADITPDVDLDVMTARQQPAVAAARIMERLDPVLENEKPDIVLVQGDTTSTWAGALAAFYRHIPVGHVEAGLRSGDRFHPFPEEMHRRLVGVLADYHFAPTAGSAQTLLGEKIAPERISVTGNTVVDALQLMRERTGGRLNNPELAALFPAGRRVVILTTHRRESWGRPLREAYAGLRQAIDDIPDVHIVFPLHLNPAVREAADTLRGHPRIHLIEPPSYPEFVEILARCYLVLTDSGGIQEEAPSLGKPVLILREQTERIEGLQAGVARLVGLRAERVASELKSLLTDERRYAAMRAAANPYGDGRAAERILGTIEYRLGRISEPPVAFSPD